MKWITTATLPAGLVLLLAATAPSLHGQAAGVAAPAPPADATAPDRCPHPAGGADSGGGELPKHPLKPGHDKNPHAPPPPASSDAPPMDTPQGKGGSGAPDGGGGGGDPRGLHQRRLLGKPGGGPDRPHPATVTTAVRLLSAAGEPVANALLVASTASGQVLAIALTDARGIALLQTASPAGALLQIDVASGAFAGVEVAAGSSVEIVLPH